MAASGAGRARVSPSTVRLHSINHHSINHHSVNHYSHRTATTVRYDSIGTVGKSGQRDSIRQVDQ